MKRSVGKEMKTNPQRDCDEAIRARESEHQRKAAGIFQKTYVRSIQRGIRGRGKRECARRREMFHFFRERPSQPMELLNILNFQNANVPLPLASWWWKGSRRTPRFAVPRSRKLHPEGGDPLCLPRMRLCCGTACIPLSLGALDGFES